MPRSLIQLAVKSELDSNSGKLSAAFVTEQASLATVTYHQLSPNMRACVLRLPSGHEVLGVAQVLDSANDVQSIGESVAYANATAELWKVFGTIALSL